MSSGRAAAEELRVAWQAPSCAQEREFRVRLRHALHKDPQQPADDLALSVEIREQAASGFQLVVRARPHDKALERVLEPKTCADALEAAAVLVALAVDPNARPDGLPSPAPARESPEKRGPIVRSALLFGVSVHELPRAAPLLSADTGLDFGAFSARLEGFWLAPEHAQLASQPQGRGGDIAAFGAGLAACYLPVRDAGRLATCVSAQVGAWSAKGSGVLHPESKLEPWLSGGVRVRYVVPLGARLGWLLQADAIWLGSRPRFFLDDLGVVYVPPEVGARFGSGLELSF
ncbi:MAG TPA: hypothetical protein VGL19_10215 [Polyangiaceae bacterium]